jgi:hypothetical protein
MIYLSRYLASLLFLAATLLPFEALAGTDKPLTVVELFTSQGCSSCPPADAYLGDLANLGESKRILALSYHVDYWDNLGWKDPYSNPDNTSRQRAYANYMDLRYIYTPQMVIQGKLQATGSDRQAIAAQIKTARKLPGLDVRLQRKSESIQVILGKIESRVNASIFMVIYDKQHVTKIKRGENSGKTITNRNVVRSIKNIGSWNGEAKILSLPLQGSGDDCAVLIQSRATGAILGAATISIN